MQCHLEIFYDFQLAKGKIKSNVQYAKTYKIKAFKTIYQHTVKTKAAQ